MKFRFSIRDLLWLTVLAAVLVAWCLYRSRLAAQIDEPLTGPVKIEFNADLDKSFRKSKEVESERVMRLIREIETSESAKVSDRSE